MTIPNYIYFQYFGCPVYKNFLKRIKRKQQNIPKAFIYFVKMFVFMFIGQNINKQAHILNGNIRSFSYKNDLKYCYWNCDRGFLSKEKIEDI